MVIPAINTVLIMIAIITDQRTDRSRRLCCWGCALNDNDNYYYRYRLSFNAPHRTERSNHREPIDRPQFNRFGSIASLSSCDAVCGVRLPIASLLSFWSLFYIIHLIRPILSAVLTLHSTASPQAHSTAQRYNTIDRCGAAVRCYQSNQIKRSIYCAIKRWPPHNTTLRSLRISHTRSKSFCRSVWF